MIATRKLLLQYTNKNKHLGQILVYHIVANRNNDIGTLDDNISDLRKDFINTNNINQKLFIAFYNNDKRGMLDYFLGCKNKLIKLILDNEKLHKIPENKKYTYIRNIIDTVNDHNNMFRNINECIIEDTYIKNLLKANKNIIEDNFSSLYKTYFLDFSRNRDIDKVKKDTLEHNNICYDYGFDDCEHVFTKSCIDQIISKIRER